MNDKQIFQQRGLYYDELKIGVIYRHAPGRTLIDSDNTLFSALTMNQASIHVDAHASLDNEFGGPLINSMLTLSTLVGLSVGHLTQKTLVANLGFTDISFPEPVVSGDTLYAETEIQEKRDSKSRTEAGIVLMEHRAFNQHGVLVATAKRYSLMMRNPNLEKSQ